MHTVSTCESRFASYCVLFFIRHMLCYAFYTHVISMLKEFMMDKIWKQTLMKNLWLPCWCSSAEEMKYFLMMSMMRVVLLDHRSKVNCRLLLLFDEVKLLYSSIVHRIDSHISVSFTHQFLSSVNFKFRWIQSHWLKLLTKMHRSTKNNGLRRFVDELNRKYFPTILFCGWTEIWFRMNVFSYFQSMLAPPIQQKWHTLATLTASETSSKTLSQLNGMQQKVYTCSVWEET